MTQLCAGFRKAMSLSALATSAVLGLNAPVVRLNATWRWLHIAEPPAGCMAQLWVYKWPPVLLWTAAHLCGRNLWHFNGTSSAAAAKTSHFNGKRVAPPSWPIDCTSSMETGWQAQFVHFYSNNEKRKKFWSNWNQPLITSLALFGHQQHPLSELPACKCFASLLIFHPILLWPASTAQQNNTSCKCAFSWFQGNHPWRNYSYCCCKKKQFAISKTTLMLSEVLCAWLRPILKVRCSVRLTILYIGFLSLGVFLSGPGLFGQLLLSLGEKVLHLYLRHPVDALHAFLAFKGQKNSLVWEMSSNWDDL